MKTMRKRFYRTFRSQLLWNYWLTLGLTFFLAGGLVGTAVSFFVSTDRIIQNPAELARISADLNRTHQYITNYINYSDPQFIELFHQSLTSLERQMEIYSATAALISSQQRDIEFLYAWLELRNQMQWYRERSDHLLERASSEEEERFTHFYRLYQLRDLHNLMINEISGLLFRLMNYVQADYDVFQARMQRQWFWLFLTFGVVVVGLVRWATYQARLISMPIQHLIRQGEMIAESQFNIEEAPNVRNQELQSLNRTFSIMAERIAHSIDVLSQKNELERKNLVMAQSLKQAELELLQSQINPHFLFNTLNTLTSLAQIEGADKTEELLASFSTFLRYNLKNMHSIIAIRREVEMIEHYLYIQKQRFGARLEYAVSLAPEARDYLIPSLTIQPLVENALIHGIEPLRAGGCVAVTVEEEEPGLLLIRVEDSGTGIDAATAQRVTSIQDHEDMSRDHVGLDNTLRRIRLFDPEAQVTCTPGADGVTGTVFTFLLHSHIGGATPPEGAAVFAGSAVTETPEHL